MVLFAILLGLSSLIPASAFVPADAAPSSLSLTSTIAEKIETPAHLATSVSSTYRTATPKAATIRTAATSYTQPTVPSSYVAIGGQTSPIFTSSSTTVDAGHSVALYNSKFLYGHRNTSVFSQLAGLSVGSTFTVTLNGQTSSYVVAGKTTLDKQTTQSYMYSFAIQGAYQGKYYDYVLMTCAGESLAGGDATHRTIVFANKL